MENAVHNDTSSGAPLTLAPPSGVMSDWAMRLRSLSVKRWGETRAVEMVGCAPCFCALQERLDKVARYREPVLITGESGVGKELVAQAIYLLSHPPTRPYIAVNCPQYQDGNLTVSELFGHKRGSFTGAIADRKGAFEQADKGVIFLDEIGDLHQGAQAMLLRTLSTGEYMPLGGNRSSVANVRVVAATNRPLNQLMLAERFRKDLFFRLRHFHLPVPALRERGDDWRLMLDHVLIRLGRQYGIAKRFSSASLKLLARCEWPGNIRQLIGVATLGYAIADGETIEPADFASELEDISVATDDGPLTQSLYDQVVRDGESFWKVVYPLFMDRDLNRTQVRMIIRRGFLAANGNYRRLVHLLHIPPSGYQKFMDFLRHHDLKP